MIPTSDSRSFRSTFEEPKIKIKYIFKKKNVENGKKARDKRRVRRDRGRACQGACGEKKKRRTHLQAGSRRTGDRTAREASKPGTCTIYARSGVTPVNGSQKKRGAFWAERSLKSYTQ